MAKKEDWNIDPWNEQEMWLKVVGKPEEDFADTVNQFGEIFGNRNGVRCLEIGAGVGRLLKFANKGFYECWGVDSSVSIVALSTRYLRVHTHARVVLSDGLTLPFPTNYFNFVYSFTCFQHMEELNTITSNLDEARRVLVPGGKILIQTVCGTRGNGRHDGYVFESREEFAEEFRKADFKEVEVDQKGEWLWARAKKQLIPSK
jgi:SAM-dependent methyltransferase